MKKTFSLFTMLILSAFVWIPILFLIGGSFMGKQEIFDNLAPVLQNAKGYASWDMLPLFPTLRPYVELLLDSPEFFVMFWNSVKLTFGILLGQLVVGVPVAWGFAKYNFPFKKTLFTVYIVLMLMPFQVTMVSNYLVLDKLGLMNTHWSIILPAIFSTFPVFIMMRFFSGIPTALIEAAAIDGADKFQIFIHIALPLGAPGIISAMVLGFLEYWNMIEQPLIFLKDKSLWPLSLYLPNIALDNAGIALCASVVTLIPAILVFLYGQSYLEQGIIASGVKE